MHLGPSGNDVAKQRFSTLHVDGKIVVNEEHGHLSFFFAGARLQQQEFIDHALVAAKSDGVSEESRDGAELAPVRTSSSGLDRNNAKCSPAFSHLFQ